MCRRRGWFCCRVFLLAGPKNRREDVEMVSILLFLVSWRREGDSYDYKHQLLKCFVLVAS